VTKDQRVFYVAFKWVQEHWPKQVEDGEHVSDVPVDLYLDSREVINPITTFKAKIRVYNTAAHLVICKHCQGINCYIMIKLLCAPRIMKRERQPKILHSDRCIGHAVAAHIGCGSVMSVAGPADVVLLRFLLVPAAPYSKMSALYVGCYMAGYAYNPDTHSIRVYISREKPDITKCERTAAATAIVLASTGQAFLGARSALRRR
jgi:hypothetical protein